MSAIPVILLVEDNEDDYEATARSLKKNHFLNPVHWSKNGREALEFLKTAGETGTLPDLILLDLNMPGIDGRQVLAAVKGDAQLRHIPVIVLTTSNDSRDIDTCYDIGASTYIQKPVSFEGLTEAIRTMKDYWFGIALLPNREKAGD
jgi:two-component system response regulator